MLGSGPGRWEVYNFWLRRRTPTHGGSKVVYSERLREWYRLGPLSRPVWSARSTSFYKVQICKSQNLTYLVSADETHIILFLSTKHYVLIWVVLANSPCVLSNWCTKVLTEILSVTTFSTTRPPPKLVLVLFVLFRDGLGARVCISSWNPVLVMSKPSFGFPVKNHVFINN